MANRTWKGGKVGAVGDWAQADNWVELAVPANGDDVRIPKTATVALDGGNYTATLLASFTVEKGCPIAIGSDATKLRLDADTWRIAGTGQKFIEINNPTSDVLVTQSGADSGSRHGTNITGAGIARLVVHAESGATVGVADGAFETCTCSEIAVDGGSVEVGEGVTKVGGGAPNINVDSGSVEAYCAVGSVWNNDQFTHHAGTSTAVYANGGTTKINSSGTPSLIMLNGARLEMGPAAANPTDFQIFGRGWHVEDPFGRITSAWEFHQSSPWHSGTARVPANKAWTPGAIA